MIKKFLIFSFLLTLINSHFLFYENPMCSPIYQCMPDPTNTRCVETKTKEGLETQYVQKCGMDTECQLNETLGIGECVTSGSSLDIFVNMTLNAFQEYAKTEHALEKALTKIVQTSMNVTLDCIAKTINVQLY